MAKQEKQKQKNISLNRQTQSAAHASTRISAAQIAKTTVNTIPLPSPTNAQEKSTYSQQTQPLVEIPVQPPLISRELRRRQLLLGGVGLAVSALVLGGLYWVQDLPHLSSVNTTTTSSARGDQLVVRWNEAALQVIRNVQPAMPVAARALAIVHTAMFDAWAAYDSVAQGTRLGGSLRRPFDERTQENKREAISYAAYIALLNLFPSELASLQQIMLALNYDPQQRSKDMSTPAGIGNLTAQAVLDFRANDGSNQSGKLAQGAYADYTGYKPVNTLNTLKNPSRWQPLRLDDPRTGLKDQQFDCAQWGDVTPFALASAIQFVPRSGPAKYPDNLYITQAQQMIQYSANLTDEQKAIAEYWANGPKQERPAGHWSLFAQFISQRDNHTLDQNIKLFFALGNAMLDASIACWATKRAYNSESPATAIRYLYKGKQIRAWAGANKGVQFINGQDWLPYQPLTSIAPGPEYCSEQSVFSAAAAAILRNFTGSDRLETSYTWLANSSQVESNVPATDITLDWPTFTDAANQAGMAGRYGGIHFEQSDLDGRTLGQQIGEQVWQKYQQYLNS